MAWEGVKKNEQADGYTERQLLTCIDFDVGILVHKYFWIKSKSNNYPL